MLFILFPFNDLVPNTIYITTMTLSRHVCSAKLTYSRGPSTVLTGRGLSSGVLPEEKPMRHKMRLASAVKDKRPNLSAILLIIATCFCPFGAYF